MRGVQLAAITLTSKNNRASVILIRSVQLFVRSRRSRINRSWVIRCKNLCLSSWPSPKMTIMSTIGIVAFHSHHRNSLCKWKQRWRKQTRRKAILFKRKSSLREWSLRLPSKPTRSQNLDWSWIHFKRLRTQYLPTKIKIIKRFKKMALIKIKS